NSVDEALAGFSTKIAVTIHQDNAITVVDDGRGIPVDTHKTEKKPGVEVALTMLHAGGKFDKTTYKVSGGLHGVGVSVVNALSEQLEVWVDRDGKRHHMAFERGDTKKRLETVGKAKGTGTTVGYKPGTEVEGALQYDDQYSENTFTFVNNINTHEGGTHLTGFKSALTRTINEWAKKDGLLKKEEFTLTGDDVREGLNCVLHVKVKQPQ